LKYIIIIICFFRISFWLQMIAMGKKINKTLYLPSWIIEVLDFEGDRYDGPGVVAASAIHHFSIQKQKDKKAMLKEYRSKEVDMAYKDESVAGQILAEPGYSGMGRKSSKSG